MSINLNNLFAVFLIFLCLFPYISIVNTPFDTQPYALVFSCIIIVLIALKNKELKFPKIMLTLLFIMVYACFVFLFNISFTGIRSLVGYISVFIIGLASYLTFHYVKGKWLFRFSTIWLAFGLVQLVVKKDFGSFIVSRLTTTESRGVTSLAVEPSYYAIVCIFFLILNDVFYAKKEYKKKTYNLIFLMSFFQILFLSRATLGLMLLVVYLVAKVFSKKNSIKKMLSFVSLVVGLLGVLFIIKFIPSLQYSRMGQLLNAFFYDPIGLITSDDSIADRLSHVLISHLSVFHSNGFGFGLGTWQDNAIELSSNSGYFIASLITEYFSINRIMSGWGTIIYELGIVGVLFVFSFIYIMYRGYKKVNSDFKSVYVSSFITLYFVMLMSVPISFPLFGYLIGLFVNIQLKQQKISKVKEPKAQHITRKSIRDEEEKLKVEEEPILVNV